MGGGGQGGGGEEQGDLYAFKYSLASHYPTLFHNPHSTLGTDIIM